jgi:hypothetical protein
MLVNHDLVCPHERFGGVEVKRAPVVPRRVKQLVFVARALVQVGINDLERLADLDARERWTDPVG